MSFVHIRVVDEEFEEAPSKNIKRFDFTSDLSSVRVKELFDRIKLKEENKPNFDFELIFAGRCLQPEENLAYYGIENGAFIFVMPKSVHAQEEEQANESKSANKRQKLNTPEMDLVMSAIHFVMLDSDFRSMLRRLCDTETCETLLERVPALAKDIVALSMLQDTALLTSLLDPSSLNKVLEQHPALIDAAAALVSMFEEMYGPRTVPQMTPAQMSRALNRQEDQYSLMNLSDEEDDMEGAGAAPSNDATANSPFRNVTAASNQSNAASTSSNSNQRTNPPARRGAEITLEMLRQALGIVNEPNNSNSLSNVSTSTTNSSSNRAANLSSNSTDSITTTNNSTNQPANHVEAQNWTMQLRQMHSLGLLDDAVNIHALHASNGDVQAAIDLIFSGVFS